MFDTAQYDEKFANAVAHFENELKKIRTGRAHPSMLDAIQVEVYGTRMPLNQAANITAPEAQMLLVSPFDPSNIDAITTAIRHDQSLGFNPSDDGRVIRVPVPPLTEERRVLLVKQAGEKLEDARIALRTVRQEALKDAKHAKDNKTLSEDEYKTVEKSIDSEVKKYQETLDTVMSAKEQDILTI